MIDIPGYGTVDQYGNLTKKATVTVPQIVTTGPNSGQIITQTLTPPFPGAKYMSSSGDTVVWSDTTQGKLRYFKGNEEIGTGGPTGQVHTITTTPTKPAGTTTTPPTDAAVPKTDRSLGITAAEYDAYKKSAEDALVQMGVSVRDGVGNISGIGVSDDDVVRFATTQATPEQVDMYYRGRADILAKAPWVAFDGMGEQDYKASQEGYKAASKSVFGREDALGGSPETGSLQDRRSSLLGYATQNKIRPDELAADSERFRQRFGRAPTTSTEYATFRAEPQTHTRSASVKPYFAYNQSGAPKLPGPTTTRAAVPKK